MPSVLRHQPKSTQEIQDLPQFYTDVRAIELDGKRSVNDSPKMFVHVKRDAKSGTQAPFHKPLED
mgnify:CR=1 FL=1